MFSLSIAVEMALQILQLGSQWKLTLFLQCHLKMSQQ